MSRIYIENRAICYQDEKSKKILTSIPKMVVIELKTSEELKNGLIVNCLAGDQHEKISKDKDKELIINVLSNRVIAPKALETGILFMIVSLNRECQAIVNHIAAADYLEIEEAKLEFDKKIRAVCSKSARDVTVAFMAIDGQLEELEFIYRRYRCGTMQQTFRKMSD